MPPTRQEDEMFARNCFPATQPVTGDDHLSEMAHAMGCGTLAEEGRPGHPAFLVRDGHTWLVERRPPAQARHYG